MNYVEVLPISEYEGALHDRLPAYELSSGALYNAIFTLKEHRDRAIRFNTLLSNMTLMPDVTIELSPVDADLKPLGWFIYTDMHDGVMKVAGDRSAGLIYVEKQTRKPGKAMLHTGILRAYQDPVDLGPILEMVGKKDLLVIGG